MDFTSLLKYVNCCLLQPFAFPTGLQPGSELQEMQSSQNRHLTKGIFLREATVTSFLTYLSNHCPVHKASSLYWPQCYFYGLCPWVLSCITRCSLNSAGIVLTVPLMPTLKYLSGAPTAPLPVPQRKFRSQIQRRLSQGRPSNDFLCGSCAKQQIHVLSLTP